MTSRKPLTQSELDLQRRIRIGLLCVLVVLLAGLARFYAALGDFWLDEVWSWFLAGRLNSPADVLFELKHENNHFLNTWILYFLGPGEHWVVYRIPAVIAGIGTVIVCGLISARRGAGEAVMTLVLIGGSYPLIHFSSEARGYSYVLFFSATAFLFLERALRRPDWRNGLLFGTCCVLGFLSQPMFVYFYISAFAWSSWAWLRERPSGREFALRIGRCHALPILFAGGLYYVNLREMINAGGTIFGLRQVLVETLSLTFGGPFGGPAAIGVALIAIVIFFAGVEVLRRSGHDEWLFHVLVIAVAPAILLAVVQRQEVYPRYFLISVLFLLLLAGELLAMLWQSGRAGRIVGGLLLVVFLVGNGRHTARLIEVGRGGYWEALQFMERRSPEPTIRVGSDHDFRNGMLLSFYSVYTPLNKRLEYFPQDRWHEGPEWMILHDQEMDWTPPETFASPHGHQYRLAAFYPYAGLSGWHWALYRRDTANAQTGESPFPAPL